MQLLGLHPLDALIVLACLSAILWIGIRVSRGVEHQNDFFVGGRKMGPILQFFLNFGTMTDSTGAPTVASEVYRQGAGGLWIPFQPLFSTPFYWFSSIWWRRSRLITGPDQFIERFNSKRLAMAIAWWGVVMAPLGGALGNIISYKVAAAMFAKPESAYTQQDRDAISRYHEFQKLRELRLSGQLPQAQQKRYDVLESMQRTGLLESYVSYIRPLPFYITYTAIVAVYILMGGIKAAAYTDMIQGLLIIAFSIVMIPAGLAKVGGLAGLHALVPEHFFRVFGSAAVSDYSWYSIAAFVILGTACIASPAGCGAGRDEQAIRIGVLGGAFAKRFVMIAWLFCGLLAVALFPNGGIADPENAWGTLSRSLLGPGLLGLMISGILLGHMPGVGMGAVGFAANFARNLYEPMFPGKSPRHYMITAKLAVLFSLISGIVGALFFSGIITLFVTFVSVGAFFGILGLLMLFWRKLSARAVGYGWIFWMILLMGIPWGLPRIAAIRRSSALTLQTPTRTVMVNAAATQADVDAGLAPNVGGIVRRSRLVEPKAVFFEAVAHANVQDPSSPLEGVGRFHVENYLLWLAGVPVQTFTASGLNAIRWLFDATGPFVVLVMLSYLLPDRYKRATTSAAAEEDSRPLLEPSTCAAHDGGTQLLAPTQPRTSVDPAIYANVVMQGNVALLYNPDETQEQARVRLDRFYVKLKTPIAATPEEDEQELARSFSDPSRFDHLKLFRRSDWEFTRWNRLDFLGFVGLWFGVIVVLLFFKWVLVIGT